MYNVAPMFCPPSSWLHECYSSEYSHRIKVVVGPVQWGTCTRTVLGVAANTLTYWNNNIATTSPTKCEIIILYALTGSQTAVLSGHTDSIRSLTYSLDGTFLVSGSNDKTIKLWDVQTGGIIKTLCGHTDQVVSVAISADNTMIASASYDRTISLWNIKTGSCCIIEKDGHHYSTVAFSPTNLQLLFSSCEDTMQQWDINGHKIGSPILGNHDAFSPDGTQFVSHKWGTVTIRNTDSKIPVVEFKLFASAVKHCCFSPNGQFIAAAADCTIHLWDITGSDPYLIQTFTGHKHAIASLVFSSPYNLISASHDKSIKFWQIGASSVDPVLPDSNSSSLTLAPIIYVGLQARNGLAFSVEEEGMVKTWDILAGCYKESYKSQIGFTSYADIQLIGDRMTIVWQEVGEPEINVWDAEKGKLQTIHTLKAARGLRMIGDGSRVLQLCEDSIRVWDTWTGESVYEERLERDNGSFDPLQMDGSKVLVRFGESSVQGWDFGAPGSTPIQFSETSSGKPHFNIIDVREWSNGSPVRIEDSVTGKEVFQLYGRYADPSAIQWDGLYLIAGYETGEVLIFYFGDALS